MDSKSKKNKGSGLRILWIPTRKRHNRKGQYDSTTKRIDYSTQQKRNQQWSLGGSKTQEKLVQGNLSDDIAPACSSIAVSCAAGAGAGVLHKMGESDIATTNDIDKIQGDNESKGNENNDTKVKESEQEKTKNKINKDKKKDEKVVNYIYYSLMCCECSIS